MKKQTTLPGVIPHGRFANKPIEDVPEHHQQWMVAMNTSVATKIDQLLQRVAGVKRGTAIDRPTKFDRRGQQHAEAVARKDRDQ